ncbi:MAG TPA: hypothetical protein VKR53_03515 [Puia sp.]|nr:hypothetical protein [Puia sp.]
MKGYNTLYYLLFVMLIMGAFASMAQNTYGLKILGGVAIAFAVLFLIQFTSSLHANRKKEIYFSIELACLFILSGIFALRVFYINFSYVELIFGLASLILILLYFRKLLNKFSFLKPKNKLLSVTFVLFYLSIILYFISLGSITFLPKLSETAGILGLVFLMGFMLFGLVNRNYLIDGENISAFKAVSRLKDNSILIISLFLLFTLYNGFTMNGILPKVYSDEFPQTYFELVNKAESGKEKAVNGKYKYQEFKEKYDRFIEQSK